MAIDRNATYTIRNESGVEHEVRGWVLQERALANEPDTIDGVPIRQFVRESVDVEDTVARAHEQYGIRLGPLADRDAEAQRTADIRALEFEAAVGSVVQNVEDDNLPNAKGDVLDPRDSNQDGIPDRLDPENVEARKQAAEQARNAQE